jgi:putative transposase
MRDWQGQSHVKWCCKYHVVFGPKYRKRSIYGPLRRGIGGIILVDSSVNAGPGHLNSPTTPDHGA